MKQKIKPCKSKVCKACGLYLNQLPVLDYVQNSDVFWVGLSAVQFDEGIEQLPLSPATRSGALIDSIESKLRDNLSFYKTNIVKCLPLKGDGKIRYPLDHEMEKCYPNFEIELNTLSPSVVFLLGKQVSTFVMKRFGIKEISLSKNFKYNVIEIDGTFFVPIHHPSYILVYKRKLLSSYISNIQSICRKLVVSEIKFSA